MLMHLVHMLLESSPVINFALALSGINDHDHDTRTDSAASAQGLVFHLMEHPHVRGFRQCVTMNSFSHKWAEVAYNAASVCGLYFLPVAVIVVCYAGILRRLDLHTTTTSTAADQCTANVGRNIRSSDACCCWRRLWGKSRGGHLTSPSHGTTESSPAADSRLVCGSYPGNVCSSHAFMSLQ